MRPRRHRDLLFPDPKDVTAGLIRRAYDRELLVFVHFRRFRSSLAFTRRIRARYPTWGQQRVIVWCTDESWKQFQPRIIKAVPSAILGG